MGEHLKHILLIDQSPVFARVFANLLKQHNYRVSVARYDASDLARQNADPAHLIIFALPEPGTPNPLGQLADAKGQAKLIALRNPGQNKTAGSLLANRTFEKPFDTEKVLRAIAEELA